MLLYAREVWKKDGSILYYVIFMSYFSSFCALDTIFFPSAILTTAFSMRKKLGKTAQCFSSNSYNFFYNFSKGSSHCLKITKNIFF